MMIMMMMMIMIMIMDHIYIYTLKVHRHGILKIRNPSAIPARSNVRVAPNMLCSCGRSCFGVMFQKKIYIYIYMHNYIYIYIHTPVQTMTWLKLRIQMEQKLWCGLDRWFCFRERKMRKSAAQFNSVHPEKGQVCWVETQIWRALG